MDSCLERALAKIRRATDGMSAAQLGWHPQEKWSAAQILEHLSLAFSGTARGMERAIKGEISCPPRTMKESVAVFVVVGFGYMPGGRHAPKGTVPGPGDPQNAVSVILENLTAMDKAIARVEQAKGSKVRLPHPILGPLTLPQWRKFHWVHTAHHMKQIDRLREMQKSHESQFKARNGVA